MIMAVVNREACALSVKYLRVHSTQYTEEQIGK